MLIVPRSDVRVPLSAELVQPEVTSCVPPRYCPPRLLFSSVWRWTFLVTTVPSTEYCSTPVAMLFDAKVIAPTWRYATWDGLNADPNQGPLVSYRSPEKDFCPLCSRR